ncbi:hypothetical protein [Candidatus Reidiella endopervernicosa]|uniref:GDP-fucose protein O-fucosyltransferase n=1 Tax=Candidatus Reidiella endopervernicosa TaxID=2738883 RepID=A0A6N0HTP5_9GAMM|nr:hypothetical protein [Candidatus Reidiella endopervernicosa]QKQ25557.1 hypothetical protein HUE57_04010 [Candidatus Reidiella endopervernicosa]
MKLHHDINTQLAQRVDQIGQPYIAIHIRNTDYTTDYLDGLKSIQNVHHLPYFIATDSADALEDCRQILGTDNIYNFTKVLSKDGSPIHQNPTHENNIDAITDLLMLALGKQFIRFRLNQNCNRTDYSGFSRLAFNLHERRQVLEHLIQHRTPLISKLLWHA